MYSACFAFVGTGSAPFAAPGLGFFPLATLALAEGAAAKPDAPGLALVATNVDEEGLAVAEPPCAPLFSQPATNTVLQAMTRWAAMDAEGFMSVSVTPRGLSRFHNALASAAM